MSTFDVRVVTIVIEEHPNADALELAAVGGFRAVVAKGIYKTGDLVAYVPEAAVLSESFLKSTGFWSEEKGKGMLAGSKGNRVKPVKLRGIVSEGIVLRPTSEKNGVATFMVHGDAILAKEGDDLQEFFGIEKYVPPIPVHMAGEVEPMFDWTVKFDVENAKKYPDVLIDGENVVITEKLHGTFCQMGYIPELDKYVITSKGLGNKGLALKLNEKNEHNLYIRTVSAGEYSLMAKIKDVAIKLQQPVYLLGEVLGTGVQDLGYGLSTPEFRAFDMYVGQPQDGRYVDFSLFENNCKLFKIPMVPVLYNGPYSYDIMKDLTDGKETVSGKQVNIREGVVVKPIIERTDRLVGRVLMKHVSEKYLTRKGGGTEYT